MKKTSRFAAVALVVTTILMCGCGSKEEKLLSDLDKLQGTWVGVEVGREGEVTMIFSGDTIDFKGAVPQEWYKGTAVINSEMMPKQADFTITECALPDYVGKVSKAIYKLGEGTLTMAGSEPGVESYPGDFGTPAGTRVFKFTLQPSN